MSTSEDKPKPDWFLILIVVIFLIVVISWFLASNSSLELIGNTFTKENIGTYGDSFGGLNTLFAGLAFWSFLIALYLQRKEMNETRQVLAEQAEAQKTQTIISFILQEIKVMEDLLNDHCECLASVDETETEEKIEHLYNICYATNALNQAHEEMYNLTEKYRKNSHMISLGLTSEQGQELKIHKNEVLVSAQLYIKNEYKLNIFRNFINEATTPSPDTRIQTTRETMTTKPTTNQRG